MPARSKKARSGKENESGDEYVHIRISPELKTKLIIIAERSGMDFSNYCRAAMIEKARRDGHTI